jgi:cellulose synthase operon protein C
MKATTRTIGLLPAVILLLSLAGCEFSSASKNLKPVSDLDRAEAKAHRERGLLLLVEEGRVQAAIDELGQALSSDPTIPGTRFWLAWALTLTLDKERAFEQILAALPEEDATAPVALGWSQEQVSTRTQAKRLRHALQEIIHSKTTTPLTRDHARYLLGQTLRTLGKFDPAEESFERLNYISDWMVVGPFDNDQNAGFDTAYPVESGVEDFTRSYSGKLRPITWRKVSLLDYDGRVNLSALLDPSRWACGYLATFIQSPSGLDVAFRLSVFRGVKIWLNEQLLFADDQAEVAAFDQYVVGGRLREGSNSLLVKVCQRDGPWQLGMHITDLEGNPVDGLSFSTAIPQKQALVKNLETLPQPRSVFSKIAAAAEDPLGLNLFLQAFWNLKNGFFQKALQEAVRLANAHPRSPLYQTLLARIYFSMDLPERALASILAAERITPGLPLAVREQVRYEQRHHRFDRAMRFLSPLLALEPPLLDASEVLLSLLFDRGFRADALREADRLIQIQPDRVSVWKTLASLQRELEQPQKAIASYQRAFHLDAGQSSTYDDLISLYLEQGDAVAALSLLTKKQKRFPCSISSILKEAEILLAREEFDRALKRCDRVLQIAPEYWYQYKVRGDIQIRRGQKSEAIQSFHLALSFKPDNPSLREYLDYLEHRSDSAFERYGLGDDAVEDILQHVPDPSAHPEAEAIFLLDDHVTHVFRDGSSKHQVRQIYLIRNEKGQKSFGQFSVPSAASFRLEIAETIQPDGSRQEATSIRNGVIHFPSLQPGSVLHVAYHYDQSANSWMEDHFAMSFSFQETVPSLRARWVLVLPKEKSLKIKKNGDFVEERTEDLGDERAYLWTAKQAPMIHEEPYRPPMRNIGAGVLVSTVPSWDDLAHWQNSLIEDQFEIDDPIRNKTRDLVRDAATPIEKMEKIYRFVVREIRYLDHDVGIFGKKPDKAIQIFANRFGDCKDKATLMIAMLKEIGIAAAYAGVRTRDQGPVFWEVPNAQTNHIITYVPKQPGIDVPLFVDGTSQFGHFLYLPDQDQDLEALVLDGKGYQVLKTPLLPPETSSSVVSLTGRIEPRDSLVLSGSETWTGWYAASHRALFNVEGKRSENLAKELGYRYPGARLQSAEFEEMDSLSESAKAKYQLAIPGRVRQEGETRRVNLWWPLNTSRTLASVPERRYDLFLGSRWASRTNISLEIPQDHRVKTLPSAAEIKTDLLDFELRCRQEKNQVICERSFTIKARDIPKDRYPELRTLCGEIDRAEAQDIVLVGNNSNQKEKK